MKRRLLSAFLAVMMVLTMAPVAFAADEDAENTAVSSTSGSNDSAVAKIGDTGYATLQAAVDAANNGDTVTLVKDTDQGFAVPAGLSITFDVNGKTLERTGQDIQNNGTLIIRDNTKQGKIIANGGGVGIAIGVGNDSVTTIEYANVEAVEGAVITGKATGATITIEDGVFSTSDNAVIAGNGTKREGNANVITINGGTFTGNIKSTGYIACGIYAPWKDIITVNGGNFTVNNGIGIVARAGQVTVNGGTFTCTGSAKGGVGDKKFDMDAAQCVYFDASNPAYPAYNSETDYIKLQGGTFSSDVSAYCEKNYYTEQNADNTYTVKSMKDVAVAKIGDTYYKTLADAVTAADNTTVTLLKDTTENVTISTDKTFTLDLNGYTLSGGKNNGNAALLNEGTVTIKDSSANKTGTIKREDNADQTGTTYYVIKNNGTMTIEQANVINNSGYEKTNAAGPMAGSSLICNGDRADDKETTLTINDGVFEQQNFLVVKNGTFGILNVNGGKFTSKHSAIQNWYKADIMGGEINGQLWTDAYTWGKEEKEYSAGVTKLSGTTKFTGEIVMDITLYTGITIGKIPTLEISGGEMNITNWRITSAAANAGAKPVVSGGYFTTDPSAYVATGYVAGTSDVSGYSYKVVAKTETGNVEVKPAVAAPEVKVDKIPQKDQETVKAAAATVSAPTLGAAAVDEAQKIDKSKADELVKNANEVAGNTADKKLYVQSALKVEPTAYDAANKTLALEITPQYRVVASTATTADEIKLDGNTKNAQVVQDYQTMDITKATVVTMELPTGFAVADGDKLSIQHTKNGTVEYYTGTVTKKDDKFYLTFTTNGFSPFVISVPAASIGENVYPTLQAAVDSVKNNETIKLAQDVAASDVAAVTVTANKTFKIDTTKDNSSTYVFDAEKNIVAGNRTSIAAPTKEGNVYMYACTYNKPSSSYSGGSSSGKTTYKVTTSAVNNGGVNASPSNAEKGATITITLSPDKGYKLDKLTVIDGSGKSVSTVKKSDTVYTFTMPASAVTVGVSYAKADETPSKTTFNDVSANDWFASAVDYVTGKGMMNGTAANTFSPKANTTRGMLMTVLARHAGEDTTGGSVWYEKGMNWAKANGVSDGTNPQVNITREQLAAMLYRYAQNKKYDVSGAKSLAGYTDAQSVSSYAVPALQWANAAGVVTGKSGSKLDPKGYATRAEVAAMLMRFCENVEK